MDKRRTNPGDRETDGRRIVLRTDELGECDMFSNFHLLINRDEKKMKWLIDGMKWFYTQPQIDRYLGNFCIGKQ